MSFVGLCHSMEMSYRPLAMNTTDVPTANLYSVMRPVLESYWKVSLSKEPKSTSVTCPGRVVERVADGIVARADRNRLRPSNAVQAISDGGQTSQVLDFVQSTAGEVRRSDVIVAARMGRRLVNIPWKRLNAAATAPPSGSSPIASRPAVAAPLAIAFWMQGFLYHGVWLFAAQG